MQILSPIAFGETASRPQGLLSRFKNRFQSYFVHRRPLFRLNTVLNLVRGSMRTRVDSLSTKQIDECSHAFASIHARVCMHTLVLYVYMYRYVTRNAGNIRFVGTTFQTLPYFFFFFIFCFLLYALLLLLLLPSPPSFFPPNEFLIVRSHNKHVYYLLYNYISDEVGLPIRISLKELNYRYN